MGPLLADATGLTSYLLENVHIVRSPTKTVLKHFFFFFFTISLPSWKKTTIASNCFISDYERCVSLLFQRIQRDWRTRRVYTCHSAVSLQSGNWNLGINNLGIRLGDRAHRADENRTAAGSCLVEGGGGDGGGGGSGAEI